MKCYEEVKCPKCGGNQIMKSGLSNKGAQRYCCKNPECKMNTFMLSYRNKAYEAGVKKQIVDMAINGSGIRDTARVLGISRNTVVSTIKKSQADCQGQS